MRDLVRRLHATGRVLVQDLGDAARRRLSPPPELASELEAQCVDDLRRDGACVVEGWWPRDNALDLKARLEARRATRDVRHPSGAYQRVWSDRAADSGVQRFYHVDREFPELQCFRLDEGVLRIAWHYCGVPMHSGALVWQHNAVAEAGTRGFHVDGFERQFKSFLYLDDVNEENGPFTYLVGSHRLGIRRIIRQLHKPPGHASTGYSEAELPEGLEERSMMGEAGALVLADVRGLHRGAPQRARSRSILVNYMYRSPGDVWLDLPSEASS